MIPYSLHAAIVLSVCLLFYKVLLQRQTYYRLNRFFLLSCLVLSFVLPVVPVPQNYSLGYLSQTRQEVQIINPKEAKGDPQGMANIHPNRPALLGSASIDKTLPVQTSLVTWFWRLYWCGVFFMGANFLLQIIVLFYQCYKNPVIKDGKFRIVELDDDKAPCSFANYIFINPAKYDWDTYNQILLHEKIHIVQVHTIDIMLTELALIFQWFNPFAWYYRKALENNLEFLTDDEVLQSPEIIKENYQMSLLKVSAPHFALSLTTNYNQSLLKKRILMMRVKRSNLHTLWKYGMLAPVLAFMVCALNQTVAGNTVIQPHRNANQPGDIKLKINSTEQLAPQHKTKDSLRRVAVKHNTKIPVALKKQMSVFAEDSSVLSTDTLFLLRAQGITPVFMKDFQGIGFRSRSYADWITLKKYNINPSEVKQFMDLGFRHISANELSILSDLKITPEYIKGFQRLGYQKSPLANFYTFKVRKISTEYIKGFNQLGFLNIPFQDITSIKAVGLTSEFIAGMQQQGYHYREVKKYIQLLPFGRKLMKDGTYQVLLPSGG